MLRGMTKLRALWSGNVPLDEAFWTWTVTVGLAVNLVTSVLFLALLLQDRPLAAVVAGYTFSVPYNAVAAVGVWRSAARHEGSRLHADLARAASLVLMIVLTIT
jgi:hypothetical protein